MANAHRNCVAPVLSRAKDAVRAGKLLKADWLLLGAEAKLATTNSMVVCIVESGKGVLRDAAVFPAAILPMQLALDHCGLRQAKLRHLPAQLSSGEASHLLCVAPHDVPLLVSKGLLEPLGHPTDNAVKYFALVTLEELKADVNWQV
jgi:hypothetical protein